MLDEHNLSTVKDVINTLRDRQLMLFSATIARALDTARSLMKNP